MRIWFALLLLLPVCGSGKGKTDSLLRAIGGMRKDDTARIAAGTQLAWSYLAGGDTLHTLQYLHESSRLSVLLRWDKGILESWNNLGLYYTRFGTIDSAVGYFLLGLQQARKMGKGDAVAKSCLNIAGAYMSAASYTHAIRYYLEALKYLEQADDREKVAVNYHCIGIAYYLLKDYQQSLKYYNMSLEVGVAIHKPDESGYNYNGIGVVYKDQQQYDSALHYLEKANADATRKNDVYLLAHNLSDRGEVYLKTGRYAESRQCLHNALGMHRLLSDQRGIAETEALLGDLYIYTREGALARKYYDSSLAIATATGLKDVQKNAWKGLAAAYKALHDPAASMAAFEHYANLKDTLYTEESSKQIAEMQTRYNTEKKEKENEILQKQNALESLQIARERNQKYLLGCSLVFVIAAGAGYYNWYRMRQNSRILQERGLRAHAVLQAQEQEKARLSKDLHDGVGATLALIKLNISSIAADAGTEQLLTSTKKLASEAIKEVRGISHDLMPGVLINSGLQAAITEVLDAVNIAGTITTQLHYGLTERLDADAERNLFRIVQEATNNIVRHAGATKMSVTLVQAPRSVTLTITDNGKGMDHDRPGASRGNGLNNIYSRADLMKGVVTITGQPGKGTDITITIPYNKPS